MGEWRPVPEPAGVFEASADGRIRSVSRVIWRQSRWGKLVAVRVKGRERKPQKCSNDYLAVALRERSYLAHRLVALAWVPNPGGLDQVNHKNGDRADNRAENLEWMSCGDNHRHSHRKLGRRVHALTVPVSVGGAKYESQKAAAKAIGVAPGSIRSALKKGHLCRGMEVIEI